MFEEKIFEIYKSIKPETAEKIIPFIDFIRKTKNKPPIPLKQKLARIHFPDFSNQKVIMLHGVSVGEILSLENLIKSIKKNFPDVKLVLTAGTVTGFELANKKYEQYADFITYFPLDFYKTVETFLENVNPSIVLIAETELWPNFAYYCRQKNIPLYIINGRISDKSYPKYLKIKKFISIVLACYSGVFCQSGVDKQKFVSLGANPRYSEVMKNLKFEIEKKVCDINLYSEGYKVLIAGSTHKGEDEIVLEAYKKLRQKNKNIRLIIAPRHLTRVDEVHKLCLKYKFSTGFRTKNNDFIDKDIIILDTLGELSKIYDIVDVAFIGGSFNKTGGHNPLEAIIYSKPVVSGPSVKNFRDIYSILTKERAAFVVNNKKEFYSILEELLTDDDYYEEISKNAADCFKNQQGALQFVIDKIKEILVY